MVAIVAGNGLGLFNASLNSLGGAASGGQGTLGQAGGQAFVNTSTGNLVMQFTDEQLSGLGRDLFQTRTYNTQGALNDADGDGWRWEGERRVVLTGTRNAAGSTVTRTTGDGHEAVYVWTGSLYQSTVGDGAHDTLQWVSADSQWLWTDGSRRTQERYADATGQLASTLDANGTNITYSYDASGKLSSIKDSSGQELVLVYNANGQLARLDTRTTNGGALSRQVYYTYDASGRLTSVQTDLTPENNSITDGNVYTTTYTYSGSSFRIASVTQSDGSSASFTYELVAGEYRVKTVTDASGTTTFTYDVPNKRTDVSNGLGQLWSYYYNASGQLTETKSPAVGGQRLSTNYTYDASGNVTQISDGLGNAVTYSYDAKGNRILERDAQGNTLTRTFSATNQLLNEVRYTLPATQSAGTWTNPPNSAAVVTRHIYDAQDRLRYQVSAAGNVMEYRYDANGLRTQEIVYGDAIYSVSSLAPTTTRTEAQLNTWAAARDLSKGQLTAYTYDYRGNLTQSTRYATVTSAGVGTLDAAAVVTNYVYSAHGQLLQTIAVRGATRTSTTVLSSVVYDGMGRALSQIDSSGTRTHVYNGGARSITVTNTAGQTVTQTYDTTGRLISVNQSAAGETSRSTTYVYDAAGRLTMTQDPTGARSYVLYDEAGRVSARIDSAGAVTEYSYDAAGHLQQQKQYATLANTSTWYNGTSMTKTLASQIRPASNAADRVQSFIYDDAGQLTQSTDAAGVATLFTYDGRGKLLTQQTGDRITRFFYTATGQQHGVLDAEGYLTENFYDSAGQLIRVLRWGGLTTESLRATGTLLALRPTSGTNLQTWFYYDSAGRQIGSVDNQQFVTETVYNEAGNTLQTIRYAKAYTSSISTTTTFDAIRTVAAANGNQTTTLSYDGQGRISQRTAPDGTVTTYSYDTSGRLVSETQAAGTTEARTTLTRYNAYDEVIGKLLGEASTRITAGMTTAQVQAVYAQYGLTYSYDAAGRVASVTDAAGNRTSSYYDAVGRLTHVINALGEVSETLYSAFGDVTERTQLTNRLSAANTASLTGGVLTTTVKSLVQAIRNASIDNRSTYLYDKRGLLTSSTNALSYLTAYGYNDFGDVTSITRTIASGQTVTQALTYNKRSEQLTATDDVGGLNRATQTAYDAFGRVIQQIDGRGQSYTTSYDSSGRVITVSNPLNQTQKTEYDAFGRTLKQTDALGKITLYSYNTTTRSMTVTSPEGVTLTTVSNRHGQTLTITDGKGAVTTYSYNKDGQRLTRKDGLNRTTTSTYDDDGRLFSVTDALGRVTTYGYDAANRMVSMTDAAGTTTRYTFDGQGRQVRVTLAEGLPEQRITDYAYDKTGQVLKVTQDPSGLKLTTTYTYDGLGQQIQIARGTIASPSQQVTLYGFDKLGRRVTERQDPAGLNLTTEYRYNENDQVTRKIDANGNSTDYVYDAAGRERFVLDAEGYVTERAYDAAGKLIEEVRYAHRPSGTREQVVSALSNGNVLPPTNLIKNSQFYSDSDGAFIGWDKNGNFVPLQLSHFALPLTETGISGAPIFNWDYNGLSITQLPVEEMSHDIAHINAAQSYSFSTYAQVEIGIGIVSVHILWLDGNGQTISQSDNTPSSSTSSISFERIYVTDTAPVGAVAAKVIIRQTTPAGQNSFIYAYHPQFEQVTQPGILAEFEHGIGTVSQDKKTSYIYNADGQLRYMINGLNQVSETVYDAAGQVLQTRQYDKAIPASTARTVAATAAALTSAGAQARITSYVYDAAGQLTSVTDAAGKTESYTYDAVGNRKTLTNKNGAVWRYNYDNLDRLTEELTPAVSIASMNTAGTVSSANRYLVTRMEYDALGNVISRSEGRLRSSVNNAASSDDVSQARTSTYGYDAVGRQVQITSPGWYNKATGQYQQSADTTTPSNTFQVTTDVTYDAVGNAVRNRVRVNNTGTVATDFVDSFKVYDVLGRVTHDIDGLKGVVAYTYDAMGNVLTTKRHANALTKALPSLGYYLKTDITSSTLVANAAQDRTLTIGYDALGRKVAVQQNSVGLYQFTGSTTSSTLVNLSPTTLYTYDAFGQVVRETQVGRNSSGATVQTGATTSYYYDVVGNQVGNVNALGYYTASEYDALGQLTRQVEYANALSSWTETILPSSPTLGSKRSTRYSYDAMGRLHQITLENVTYWQQNTSGVVSATKVTGDLNVTTNTYDNVGNIVTVADAANNVTTTQYNAVGHVTQLIEPARATAKSGVVDPFATTEITASPTTTYLVNAFGQVVQQTRAAGTGQQGLTQTNRTRYDASGYETQQIQANNAIIDFKVDVAGRRIEERQVVSATLSAWTVGSQTKTYSQTLRRTFNYDALGQQLSTTDWYTAANGTAKSTVNSAVYNRFGEVSEKRLNGNLVASYNYDQIGRLSEQTDTQGITRFDYDLSGTASRQTQVGSTSTTADDRITYMKNDLLGRIQTQHLPAFTANTSINPLTSVTLTNTTPIIHQTFDRWGNLLSQTNARGYTTYYTYDHNSQGLTETLPATSILRENGTSYTASLTHERRYDAQGQLIQEVDRVGSTELRTRQHVYNAAGQLTRDIDALGYSRYYSMDAHGNRVAVKNALGTVLTDGYDVMDQHINHKIIRNGSAVTLLTKQYDQAGRLYGEIDGATAIQETLVSTASGNESTTTGVAGNVRYTLFDERGNIVKTRNESKIEKTTEYDVDNRKSREIDALGNSLDWTYDNSNFGRKASYSDLAERTYTYEYNEFGQVVKENAPEETIVTEPNQYMYSSIRSIQNKYYSYYANGMLKDTTTGYYIYSNSGALLEQSTGTSTYAYDKTGNKTQEQNSYRMFLLGGDRLEVRPDTGVEALTLNYQGERVASSETRYKYDQAGRISEVRAPSGTALTNIAGSVFGSVVGPMRYVETGASKVTVTARIDSLKYEYDELGNRRRVYLDTTNQSNGRTIIDDWYKYDLEDRVIVSEGFKNVNGQVVAGKVDNKTKGETLSYDAIGRRLSSDSWYRSGNVYIFEMVTYENNYTLATSVRYTGDQYLRSNYTYNDLGQISQISKSDVVRQLNTDSNGALLAANAGFLNIENTYDNEGQRLSQQEYALDGEWGFVYPSKRVTYTYRGDGSQVAQISYSAYYFNPEKLSQATYFNDTGMRDAVGNQTSYRYVVYHSNGSFNYLGVYNKTYAAFDSYKESVINAAWSRPGTPGTTTMTYSSRGELLSSVATGGAAFNRTYASNREGQFIARRESNGATQSYLYFDGAALANVGNASTPEITDTFTPISADYPGLTPSNYVVNQGDTLEGIARNVWGDSKMWYLIADANGLDPAVALVAGSNLKSPNVVSSNHNDAKTFKPYKPEDVIGNTTPSPKPPPPKGGKKCNGIAAVVMVVVAVVVAVYLGPIAAGFIKAGMTAVGASAATAATVGAFGGAFVGGAVGSMASQGVGMAMGAVDKFSWKDVAVGGLTAMATVGLANAAKLANAPSWVKTAAAAVGETANPAIRGVYNYATRQVINRVVGLNTSFSWSSLAASAVGSQVGSSAGSYAANQLGTGPLTNSLIYGQVSAHSSAAIRDKWFGGDRPSYGQIAADAFGNTMADYSVYLMRSSAVDTSKAAEGDATSVNSQSASLDALRSEIVVPEKIELDLASASIATNPYERMLNAGQQPDTLTRAELKAVARLARENGGVLPRASSEGWGIDPSLIQTSRNEALQSYSIGGLDDLAYAAPSAMQSGTGSGSSIGDIFLPFRVAGALIDHLYYKPINDKLAAIKASAQDKSVEIGQGNYTLGAALYVGAEIFLPESGLEAGLTLTGAGKAAQIAGKGLNLAYKSLRRVNVPDSEAAAISRMSEGRFIPEDFGVSSIASDPKLHTVWTESLQNASLWGGRQNAYQKYLQIIEQGGTPTGKELSNAFSTVQGYFRRGADKAGIEIPAGDIHHWNFNKSAYSDQVFDPRNLFPTNSKIQHNSMHLNLGSGNGINYKGSIIPTSELKFDSSFYPLPPGFFD